MSLIGLAILLTAVVSIAWAVITREGDEGFMRVEGGLELKWQAADTPIPCLHDGVKADWLELYEQARKEVREKVGRDLFGPCIAWQLTDKGLPKYASGNLTLRVQQLDDPDHGGSTVLRWHKADGRILSADVRLNSDAAAKVRYRIMIHELGHVLGLMHDRLQDSVMFPAVNVRPGTLSTTDVKHLKTAYGVR
jgi:hypothetical protein